MTIREEQASSALFDALIAFSEDWAAEDSCWGYRKNEAEDLKDRRFLIARDEDEIVGYLFGQRETTECPSSVLPEPGTPYFEVEELYVRPARRGQGIGRALMECAETLAREEGAACLQLCTATKDWRSILHFYLDELGMDFWSARLFKKL